MIVFLNFQAMTAINVSRRDTLSNSNLVAFLYKCNTMNLGWTQFKMVN